MEFSVGDFAEQLMKEDAEQPMKPSNPHAGFLSPAVNDGPDLSNIEVPADFISSIVEGKDIVLEEEPTVQPIPPKPKKEEIKEEPVSTGSSDILLEIRDLLLELKSTLNEVTSVGSIGVGTQKPLAKEDDVDEEEEDSTTAKLKEILRKRKAKAK